MLRIKKTIRILRNNWKKSVFGAMVVTYGGFAAKERYQRNALMRNYCLEAAKFGQVIDSGDIRRITVFLNPAANRRKAKKNFEKFCAPLFYLAGIQVDIVTTKYEGEASVLGEKLDETVDAVVVAGGNGSLAETVTGLLRRCDGNNPLSKRIPVGVLPLGQTNTIAKSLYKYNNEDHVAMMVEATMGIIKDFKKPVDVIKVERLEEEREKQPIYCVNGLEWGALYDAYAKRDQYWYWGVLRSYVAYIFMGLKGEAKKRIQNCTADVSYSLPCAGCSSCYLDHEPMKERKSPMRWWSVFTPRKTLGGEEIQSKVDYKKIENAACQEKHTMKLSNVEFALKTTHCCTKCDHDDVPHVEMLIGPSKVNYLDFVSKGWKYIREGELDLSARVPVKDVELHPVLDAETKDMQWFYIDNDSFEVRPVRLKLLPKKILMFCQSESIM